VNRRRKAICRCCVGGTAGIARINWRRLFKRSERRTSTVGIADSGSVLRGALLEMLLAHHDAMLTSCYNPSLCCETSPPHALPTTLAE
jgi:hypothetical protein